MKRLRGALLALALLIGVAVVWISTRPAVEAPPETVRLLAFEPSNLVAVEVVRPQDTILLEKEGGAWVFRGRPYLPSESMIRRIGHQLHALEARGVLGEVDGADFGLGETSANATLSFANGPPITMRVGSDTPTGVSVYVEVEGAVYTVARAAVEYFRAPVDRWRATSLGGFDANRVQRLTVEMDDSRRVFEARGRDWVQIEPVEQDVQREAIRRMLGSLSALRSREFLDARCVGSWDGCGLEPPQHRVRVEGEETVEIWFGDLLPPDRVIARRADEEAAHAVSDHVLDILRRPDEAIQDRRLLRVEPTAVRTIEVRGPDGGTTIRRSADAWRWPDGSSVSGITPSRLLDALSALESTAPTDAAVDAYRVVVLSDDGVMELSLGEPGADGTFVVQTSSGSWTASGPLPQRVEALLRESP